MAFTPPKAHPGEQHAGPGPAGRLNRLRAGVLGANDGIVSVAALVVGVAGATSAYAAILTAAAAGLVGGAISMALGEFVSVSSQRDSERASIARERQELQEFPDEELAELTHIYQARGLTAETASQVARELTAADPLRAHLDAELGIVADDLANPWAAAVASACAFLLGGALPVLTILLLPPSVRVIATFAVVVGALALTGALGARLGGSAVFRPTLRVVVGGALALTATFGLGAALGTSSAF
jgi:VIT1/CCC1 family predicted Fe2+/Mn2+ transporter